MIHGRTRWLNSSHFAWKSIPLTFPHMGLKEGCTKCLFWQVRAQWQDDGASACLCFPDHTWWLQVKLTTNLPILTSSMEENKWTFYQVGEKGWVYFCIIRSRAWHVWDLPKVLDQHHQRVSRQFCISSRFLVSADTFLCRQSEQPEPALLQMPAWLGSGGLVEKLGTGHLGYSKSVVF